MDGKNSVSDRIRHRTIMDMLQDDDQASGSKKSWKAFRDKLRLKKAGAAWTSTVPIPASDIPIQTNTNRMMMRRGSARYPSDPNVDSLDAEGTRQVAHMERQRSIRLLPLETDPDEEDENNSPEDDEQKIPAAEEINLQSQTSLMALLEDYGANSVEDEGEHEAEAEPEPEPEEEDEDIGDYHICCGCTGKHKGAAFGPCGHTFCKSCTRELHVSRGNCPTCNNYILEILDIY
ncbi:E3 ubiquitin-protein ligase BRE1-like [Cynara cardunculus var. scolymus]|uniref:Zinc finger, RING/FYVE/PHD-type n=1 Tax=Cynara cardunculus var. scolymus TaxID=59895 RepID=A0A103Y799_CYNCS|nr:E3 ubiquitin-protein ligase BRE1-like [Cynara cardunculus var. scolymus]KVI03816.1 Zinc finger, RING/FYVE/PHD-type [Cynara cardunculus var. scolymus]